MNNNVITPSLLIYYEDGDRSQPLSPAEDTRARVINCLQMITNLSAHDLANMDQEVISKLESVVTLIETEGLSPDDIILSSDPYYINYIRFCSDTNLSATVSVFFSEITQKWQVIEHLHNEDNNILAQGGAKIVKKTKGDRFVISVFKSDMSDFLIDDIVRINIDLLSNFARGLSEEEKMCICFSEIVEYIQRDSERKKWMFISPLMNRGDLDKMGYRFPPDQILPVVRQLIVGVNAFHCRGYVHCDLHGKNVLVHQNVDGTYNLRVTDLDGVRHYKGGSRVSCGSLAEDHPDYVNQSAPELRAVRKTIRGKAMILCDVWQTGSITSSILCNSLQNEEVAPPLRMQLTKLQKFSKKMMATNPKKRPKLHEVLNWIDSLTKPSVDKPVVSETQTPPPVVYYC